MEEYLIYKLTFPNGKIYIGQTHHIRKNVNLRWKNGRGYVGTLVGNAIEKYSWKNVKKEIIEEHILTKEEANKKEINYIKEFSSWIGFSKNNGYNTTPGGDSNQIIPNPVYQIDFNYNIVGEFASVEDACMILFGNLKAITQIRRCCKKEKVSSKGFFWCHKKDYSNEWMPKNDELRSSVLQLDDNYKVIKKFKSITEASLETNGSRGGILQCCQRKMYKSGDSFWCYEKDYFSEWRPPKLSFLRNEPIYCYNNGIVYQNAKQASELLNLNHAKILRVCKGKEKHTGGYQFCFLKDKERWIFDENLVYTPYRDFSNEEVDFLNKNVPSKGYKWCAEQLNRSVGSVTQFVHRYLSVRPNIEESRKQITPKNQRKVRCKTTGEVFKNCMQAGKTKKSEGFNCSFSGIRRCCLGECKTSGDLEWEFV